MSENVKDWTNTLHRKRRRRALGIYTFLIYHSRPLQWPRIFRVLWCLWHALCKWIKVLRPSVYKQGDKSGAPSRHQLMEWEHCTQRRVILGIHNEPSESQALSTDFMESSPNALRSPWPCPLSDTQKVQEVKQSHSKSLVRNPWSTGRGD